MQYQIKPQCTAAVVDPEREFNQFQMFKVLLGEDAVELSAKFRIRTVSTSSLNVKW